MVTEEEGEAEGIGLGEKSRPRRLFDDLGRGGRERSGTGNLIISFITHLNRELANPRGERERGDSFAKVVSRRVSNTPKYITSKGHFTLVI